MRDVYTVLWSVLCCRYSIIDALYVAWIIYLNLARCGINVEQSLKTALGAILAH
jgi:hypothetical protein